MKQKIYYLFGLVTMLVVGLSIPAYAASGLVTASSVNVRESASTESSVIDTLAQNTKVEVVQEENGWYRIIHDSKEGYIKSDFLSISDDGPEDQRLDQDNTENKVDDSTVKKDVKVRITPAINSNILGELKAGAKIEIITKTNKWAFVENDEIIGWIPLSSFTEKKEEVKEENKEEENKEEQKEEEKQEEKTEEKQEEKSTETIYESAQTKYVAYSSVNIREKPTTDSEAVDSVTLNTDVSVIGEDNGWYKIKVEGKEGYIRKDLLSDSKKEVTSRSATTERVQVSSSEVTTGTGSEIVNYAKQYLGCPYSYGAAGSSSFDCSGFTMYVYQHFGISLPHTATGQSKYGTSVSSSELQAGDLVFFRDYETGVGIGHVGIYIGGGQFIHASSGSGYCVKISDLTSGSYANRYMCATRLI